VPDNSYAEKQSATIAAGDLPDLLLWHRYPNPQFSLLVQQGAFKPLKKFLTKENAPNLMKTPQAVWDAITINGEIYGIPRPRALSGSAVVIRKDWLDNLGLPIPKTMDDVYKTAVAFSKNDPDRNGKDDTVGLVATENLGNLEALWNAFDTGNNYRIMEDGSLLSSTVTDGRHNALEWLARLNKDGGLDKDFPLLKKTDVVEKMSSGKAGLELGSTVADFAGYIDNSKKTNPNAKFIMIDPPAGPTGKSGFNEGLGFFGQWVIPAKTPDDKVKKLIEVLDWMATDEASELKKFGIEGVHHKVENGKKVLIEDKANADAIGSLIQHNAYDPYLYVNFAAPPEIQQMQKDYLDKIPNWLVKNPVPSFFPPTLEKSGAELDKLANTYDTKIVTGDIPVSDWGKFVGEWNAMGGAQVTKEVNEWYKNQK
jgi:putative aldouronate transport system substrate-binding protein